MNISKIIAEKVDLNSNCVKDIKRASDLYHRGSKVKKLISFYLHRKNRKRYNIEIYPQCILGEIKIPHAVGIVVGKTAVIGDNVTIMPNVVVGARYSPNSENPTGRRHAIIGNNCILGTGCKILGDIIIGDNCVIGANAIVTKNILSNSTVIGVNQVINKEV